jgi:hypothetical protein
MRKRFLSQAAWLTMLMGSAFTGATVRAADAPQPTDLRSGIAEAQATGQTTAQAPVVSAGPVFAYGPVIQAPKPRQRARKPNWGRQDNTGQYNAGRSNGMRTAAPYGYNRSQGFVQPWQYAPPRYNWNPRWASNPYRYGDQTPWQNQQRSGSQSPNAMAWYNRGGRQVDAPDRSRQPNWRY